MADSFKKKMTVTDQSVLKTWANPKGSTGETNLWEVIAVDEHGEMITEKLRSFAELELGILIEYDIEPYDSPKHGRSWTVKKPRANTTQRVQALEQRVDELADRLSAVEEAVPGAKVEGF